MIPVHSELSGNPIKAQSHERHVCHTLIGAGWRPLLDRSLQEAEIHLQVQGDSQVKH